MDFFLFSSGIVVHQKVKSPLPSLQKKKKQQIKPHPHLFLALLWGNPRIVPAEWCWVSVPVGLCACSDDVLCFVFGFLVLVLFLLQLFAILLLIAPSLFQRKQKKFPFTPHPPQKKRKKKRNWQTKQTKLGKLFWLLVPFHSAFNKG